MMEMDLLLDLQHAYHLHEAFNFNQCNIMRVFTNVNHVDNK